MLIGFITVIVMLAAVASSGHPSFARRADQEPGLFLADQPDDRHSGQHGDKSGRGLSPIVGALIAGLLNRRNELSRRSRDVHRAASGLGSACSDLPRAMRLDLGRHRLSAGSCLCRAGSGVILARLAVTALLLASTATLAG